MYDLSQLPAESLPALRDSFIQSLTTFSSPSAPTGSRAIVTQLCLALSDLAFQMPGWKDVVPGMIENFGTRVECVEMLLEFLKCLVEESANGRIPISVSPIDEHVFSRVRGVEADFVSVRQGVQARDRSEELLTSQTERILGLLAMYINAPGEWPQSVCVT